MRYAIIGCGRIAPNHITAAKANKLNIVGICDIVNQKMDYLVEKESFSEETKKYIDYKEMLEQEKPELVAILTESGNHAKIAIDCINAGCNVIIEKPIALSIADADCILEAGKKNNKKICVSHQNRFNKSIVKLRDAIEGNRFGKLYHGAAHIRWHRSKEYYFADSWRGTWEQDGGTLMNQGIHNIDLLRWMFGDEIDEVYAYTDKLKHNYIEAEDFGAALVKFKNGAYGIIEGTSNLFKNDLEETLYIFGEKGTAKIGGKSLNKIDEWIFSDGLDIEEDVKKNYNENPINVYGFGHVPLYEDMIDAIKNDREPYVNGEVGKRALELVLAIYKSAAEGRPVKLPLKKASTIDYIDRFRSK